MKSFQKNLRKIANTYKTAAGVALLKHIEEGIKSSTPEAELTTIKDAFRDFLPEVLKDKLYLETDNYLCSALIYCPRGLEKVRLLGWVYYEERGLYFYVNYLNNSINNIISEGLENIPLVMTSYSHGTLLHDICAHLLSGEIEFKKRKIYNA